MPHDHDRAIDTTTTYLGLRLRHPFMAGASPLAAHLDGVRRLEDAGASAIVLHSLFEEQITEADTGYVHGIRRGDDRGLAARIEAFPASNDYPFTPDEYLEHLRRVKAAVAVPVIASLNGTGAGAWLRHARLLEQAGADALELNVYEVITDMRFGGAAVEETICRAIEEAKRLVRVPIAVKLAPFFTAFANAAQQFDAAGADGLVLFNRFYQPDISLQTLDVVPSLRLSHSDELRVRLRWLALLHGRLRASLALTGGVEEWSDAVKGILAGAHVVQSVSAVLRHGPTFLSSLLDRTTAWMQEHEFASIDAMRGRVSQATAAHPMNFERAHYIRTLHTWDR